MSSVFVTTYEIVGDGRSFAEDHFAEIARSKRACLELAKRFGATGYRPGRYGTAISSLLFAEGAVPVGWRKIGREGDRIEARPNLNTKAGKAASKELNPEGLAAPDGEKLAAAFGWNPSAPPIDGRSFYFATAMRLELPAVRYFVRLPRFTDDGYAAPETLVALPEVTFRDAINEHNRLARHANAAHQSEAPTHVR